MNLPNAITVGRIAAAPLVAGLPFVPSWGWRLAGFFLFLVVAISDYYDGMLARRHDLITDLGKQLDPLADKLFIVATFVPMYLLMERWKEFPFHTPFGIVGLPLWIVVVILGREAFMTGFRQMAAKRGVVIAASRLAKWKTGFQMTWIGAAFFWFFFSTFLERYGLEGGIWTLLAQLNGLIGLVTMVVAVGMTLWSLWEYMRKYGGMFRTPAGPPRAGH